LFSIVSARIAIKWKF